MGGFPLSSPMPLVTWYSVDKLEPVPGCLLPALAASDAIQVTSLLMWEDEKTNWFGAYCVRKKHASLCTTASVVAAKAIRQGVEYQVCQLSRIRTVGETLTNTCASRREGFTSGVGAEDVHFSLLGFQVWSSFFDALKPEEAVKPNSIGEPVTVAEVIVARGLTFLYER